MLLKEEKEMKEEGWGRKEERGKERKRNGRKAEEGNGKKNRKVLFVWSYKISIKK